MIDLLSFSESVIVPQPKTVACLVEKLSGRVIFYIPNSSDEKENEEVFYDQVIKMLLDKTEECGQYSQAIEYTQHYLKKLADGFPEHKVWIEHVANRAGHTFMVRIKEAASMLELIREGKMFLKIRSINRMGGH